MQILKGHIVHAPVFGTLTTMENGYLCLEKGGRITGLFAHLPEAFSSVPVTDYGDRLIIPSLTDLHLHAPQLSLMGTGMDLPLLDWLHTYTFPSEARFADAECAKSLAQYLAKALVQYGTTRVCMFSSIHRESTLLLMEALENAGITGYVGKVQMDRNAPDYLLETTEQSIQETVRFLHECAGRFTHIQPILTPRFIPTCTDRLMKELGILKREHGLRVQSHLSESPAEVEWVKSLCPQTQHYYEGYAQYGLFGAYDVMAHCVYSGPTEREAMAKSGVFAAHCPDSNTNLASGLAPVRRMLEEGVSVVLGSDVAGGAHLNMMDVTTEAIRVSKLRSLQTEGADKPLSFAEAFYLATSAGTQYFGAGPGFQTGDMLHALVLDDSMLPPARNLPLPARLERIFYLSEGRCVAERYSEGRRLCEE